MAKSASRKKRAKTTKSTGKRTAAARNPVSQGAAGAPKKPNDATKKLGNAAKKATVAARKTAGAARKTIDAARRTIDAAKQASGAGEADQDRKRAVATTSHKKGDADPARGGATVARQRSDDGPAGRPAQGGGGASGTASDGKRAGAARPTATAAVAATTNDGGAGHTDPAAKRAATGATRSDPRAAPAEFREAAPPAASPRETPATDMDPDRGRAREAAPRPADHGKGFAPRSAMHDLLHHRWVQIAAISAVAFLIVAAKLWVYVSIAQSWIHGDDELAMQAEEADIIRPPRGLVHEWRIDSPEVVPSRRGGPAGANGLAGPTMAEMPLERIRAAAQAGDAVAQNELGILHAIGQRVFRDGRTAAKWFERAAMRGMASAQFNLAYLFEKGLDVDADPARAVFWYLSAAEQGHTMAQHRLATIYAEGSGRGKDYASALKWYARAASSGLAESQYALGALYENGHGVGADKATAVAWYGKAAANGHVEAARRVRRLAREGYTPGRAAALKAPGPAVRRLAGRQRRLLVAQIQRHLIMLNFDPGTADGAMRRRTRNAIRLYQQFAGLEVDGRADPDLLEDLRATAGTLERPVGEPGWPSR